MSSILFSHSSLSANGNLGIFILRLGVGLLMLFGHGWGKLMNFSTIAPQFPDPIGLGGTATLALAVFAEFFCSIALIFGAFTRLATLPLIATMLVAILIIHGADPFAKQELGLLYLIPYLTILVTGPGRLSLDSMFLGRKK